METIGVAILGFIVVTFIVMLIVGIMSGINRLSNSVEDARITRKSTGLERVRLLVRKGGPTFTSQLEKIGESQRSDVSTPIWTSYILITDGFYDLMGDSYNNIGKSDAFDDLAKTVSADFNKLDVISARVFGAAFGIVVAKAANTSGKKIKKSKVIKYLNSCGFSERYKKEITRMASAYISFEQDELFGAHSEAGGSISQDLGTMAYALLDEKLGKGNYPDPTISTSMNMALATAYREAIIYDSLIEGLKAEGLIG